MNVFLFGLVGPQCMPVETWEFCSDRLGCVVFLALWREVLIIRLVRLGHCVHSVQTIAVS